MQPLLVADCGYIAYAVVELELTRIRHKSVGELPASCSYEVAGVITALEHQREADVGTERVVSASLRRVGELNLVLVGVVGVDRVDVLMTSVGCVEAYRRA